MGYNQEANNTVHLYSESFCKSCREKQNKICFFHVDKVFDQNFTRNYCMNQNFVERTYFWSWSFKVVSSYGGQKIQVLTLRSLLNELARLTVFSTVKRASSFNRYLRVEHQNTYLSMRNYGFWSQCFILRQSSLEISEAL